MRADHQCRSVMWRIVVNVAMELGPMYLRAPHKGERHRRC